MLALTDDCGPSVDHAGAPSHSGTRHIRDLLLGATGASAGLGLLAIVGLVYSGSGMAAAVRIALNQAWNVEQPRPFLRGKLVDLGLVLLVATLGLVSFVLTVAAYNAIYGSLGAVIAFMFFVYLAALLLLLGAEIASEWPRVRQQLEREDTPPKGPPLGQEIKDALRGLWAHRREQPRSDTDRDRVP